MASRFPTPRPILTNSARSPSHIATSSRNVAVSTPYQTGGHVLMAIKGISKKQDEMFEKLLDLERKVLSLMQDSFDITKVSYYPTFIEEIAKTYCTDLKRKVSLSAMQSVTTKCLGNDARSKSIFSVAISKFKERMNYFRAEERRKLIGNSPYESYHTSEITDLMMRSMKAPSSVKDVYLRHVAIARKYIRSLCQEDRSNFFWLNFRKWLNLYHPDQEAIDWVEILSDDEACIYGAPQNGIIFFENENEDSFINPLSDES